MSRPSSDQDEYASSMSAYAPPLDTWQPSTATRTHQTVPSSTNPAATQQQITYAPAHASYELGLSSAFPAFGSSAGSASSNLTSIDMDAPHHAHFPAPVPTQPANTFRCSLFWGELEPWMDEEYAKQVCAFMGWDPTSIKVPRPAPDPATGHQSNNPGYMFLTFSSSAIAAQVLGQVMNPASGATVTMPNSSKPFVLSWASSTPITPSTSPADRAVSGAGTGGTNGHPAAPAYPKEYSIFVGDLAPEASNSDLVAVFRNPVLGLRSDREPKFIRPFLSCKSAKIMLDPVTGVSRGYGFVRFTDEADQQRALIEMHGLYCLSRPMRISPATAKFKGQPSHHHHQPPQQSADGAQSTPVGQDLHPLALSLLKKPDDLTPIPASAVAQFAQLKSSLTPPNSSSPAATPQTSSTSPSLGAAPPQQQQHQILNSITAQFAATQVRPLTATDDTWKHQQQVRAILSNLIGPNGEQLTSTDPYNTTVFVGGLSPLISEDTLRTFFAPFGDIHYVKVPVGKHCGFVQFVRKSDAERAIEKMQGFPIGGSRIRLSWGRSQYKAAQAAAQAAQAAALQAQLQANPPPLITSVTSAAATPAALGNAPAALSGNGGTNGHTGGSGSAAQQAQSPSLNMDQAVELLQKLGLSHLIDPSVLTTVASAASSTTSPSAAAEEAIRSLLGSGVTGNDVLRLSGAPPYDALVPTSDGTSAVPPVSGEKPDKDGKERAQQQQQQQQFGVSSTSPPPPPQQQFTVPFGSAFGPSPGAFARRGTIHASQQHSHPHSHQQHAPPRFDGSGSQRFDGLQRYDGVSSQHYPFGGASTAPRFDGQRFESFVPAVTRPNAGASEFASRDFQPRGAARDFQPRMDAREFAPRGDYTPRAAGAYREDQDAIHDLNGTLKSLALDQDQAWKGDA